jgi:hypothetical protein
LKLAGKEVIPGFVAIVLFGRVAFEAVLEFVGGFEGSIGYRFDIVDTCGSEPTVLAGIEDLSGFGGLVERC